MRGNTENVRNDLVVCARVDRDTKNRATEALHGMGLSMSDAIRLLLVHVADEKRLPLAWHVPNSATVEAMKECEEGKGQHFDSVEDLFRDLGI